MIPAAWLAAPANGSLPGFILILFIFVIFYVLLIMPVQRRQKRLQRMLRELKTGDRVVTTGGMRWVIISLRDESVQLRIPPDNLKMEFVRSAIAHVEAPEKEKES